MSVSSGDNSDKKAMNVCTFGTLQFTSPTPSLNTLSATRQSLSLIQNLSVLGGRAGLLH
jgi:hypothetical protein